MKEGRELLTTNLIPLKGQCLLIQRYFSAVYDYAGKADLSKGYWNG